MPQKGRKKGSEFSEKNNPRDESGDSGRNRKLFSPGSKRACHHYHPEGPLKIAVIDIGTNSIHMLMADIHPNFSFEAIGREKEMTRLGDGTLANGFLSREVMERGL